MKKQPQKLAKELWRLLAKYDYVRTPQQEQVRLFSSSKPVENVDGYFGQNMSRVLRSVLTMDPALSGIQLQFVQAADTTIDLHFNAKSRVLQINHKWLDFEAVHVKTPCEFFEVAKHHDVGEIFCCDHAIEDLLELAINHMRYDVGLLPSKATELRRQSREYIRQTPRGVQVSTTPKAGELRVYWLRNRYKLVSQTYSETTVCNVTLHSASKCKPRREDLIINMGTLHTILASTANNKLHIDHLSNTKCACPSARVPLSYSSVFFANLDPNEDYFPMVWREGETAFTSFPPQCVRPLDRSKSITPRNFPSQFVGPEMEAGHDESLKADAASDNESSERDIYSATPQARHRQPVEESLDQEMDARKEAISERIWQNEEFPQLRSIVLTPRTLCNCEVSTSRGDSFDGFSNRVPEQWHGYVSGI